MRSLRPRERKFIQAHTVTQSQRVRAGVLHPAPGLLSSLKQRTIGDLGDSVDHGADGDATFPPYLQSIETGNSAIQPGSDHTGKAEEATENKN